MKWKQKAFIQNLIAARLPSNLSYVAYYFIQRRFGGLRNTNPPSRLMAGIRIVQYIYQNGHRVESKVFLEVGTGHQINLPLALWLCGASEIITVDLNPYLKAELVFDNISYIRNHQREAIGLFEKVPQSRLFAEQFKQLMATGTNLQDLLALSNIRYLV